MTPYPTAARGAALDAAREPKLPNSVIKILALSRQPTATPQEIEQHVEADPELGAMLLRVANSVVFCLNRKIDSVREAVVVLGMSRLQSLALFCGFAGVLRCDMRPLGYTRTGLLDHSIAVAVCARSLAARVWRDPKVTSQLFIAGMVHELPLVYRAVSASTGDEWTSGDPAKRAIDALNRWHVDDHVVDIISHQRATVAPPELLRKVAALRIAKAVACLSGIGMQPEIVLAALNECDLECLFLGNPEVWLPLCQNLVGELQATVASLSALVAL